MQLSFVIAIGIAAIGALLFPGGAPRPSAPHVVVQVALVTAATPTPAPPTPTPPPPPVHKVALKSVVIPKKIQPAKSAHVSHVKIAAVLPPVLSQKSNTPTIARGSLGTGGTGTGQNGVGNGSGGAAPAAAPCGVVEFIADGSVYYDRQTQYYVYDDISMSVQFPDGSHQQLALDYPWRYKDEAGDPFAHVDQPMLFEFPPVAMRAMEPPLVQYVMAHTTPEGFTSLEPCPGQG
jgi:hypothetical protein